MFKTELKKLKTCKGENSFLKDLPSTSVFVCISFCIMPMDGVRALCKQMANSWEVSASLWRVLLVTKANSPAHWSRCGSHADQTHVRTYVFVQSRNFLNAHLLPFVPPTRSCIWPPNANRRPPNATRRWNTLYPAVTGKLSNYSENWILGAMSTDTCDKECMCLLF